MDAALTDAPAGLAQAGPRAWRLLVAAVFLFAAAVCFYRLGSTPINETDEGFAGTRADSFFRHRSWVLSYDDVNDDEPQFHKPPLLYWCVAILLKLVGHNTWAVRLPTAIAGFLSALLLYKLARAHLGEWAALASALLFVTVPFLVLHIRTAMLELPGILAMLAGLACALFLPATWWRPVAVGACGGAALLIKAGGGIPAVVIPVAFGLVHHRPSRRMLLESLVALLVALGLLGLYWLAVPAEYRTRVFGELFVGEAHRRVAGAGSPTAWLRAGTGTLSIMLRWHLPAAVCGLALALARAARTRRLAEWAGVSLACVVPLLWAYAEMHPPYARYLLGAFPFLLSFSAYFAMESTASRAAAVLLLPFAWWSLALDPADPWRWLPAAAAAIALVAVWAGWTRVRSWARLAVSAALLAALTVASSASARAWEMQSRPQTVPRPGLLPLLSQAAKLVPENQKLVVQEGFTCHTILFYGRRSILQYRSWLLSDVTPGETRYGIFLDRLPAALPGVSHEVAGVSGPWMLVRLAVDTGLGPLRGILPATPDQRDAIARTLDQLGVSYEWKDAEFLLRTVPDRPEAAVPQRELTRSLLPVGEAAVAEDAGPQAIRPGDALVLQFSSPRLCSGVDVVLSNWKEPLAGWSVQAETAPGAWSEVSRIDGALVPDLAVSRGRVVRVHDRLALRARFAPVSTNRLRLVRSGPRPATVAAVTVWESPPHRETASASPPERGATGRHRGA